MNGTKITSLKWVERLDEAAKRLQGLVGTESWQDDFVQLHQRLSVNQHIVAVFGAFSAGKSSLINALLGDLLLVVSPNPTTAAVTQIEFLETPLSGVEPRQQGDAAVAQVTAKTEDQVWQDIRQAFESLHLSVSSMDEAMVQAASLKPAGFAASVRKVVAFLRSAAAGYALMKPRLGTTWLVSGAELEQLTANEQIASFVHEVRVFHHAAVLQEGISLVDTPGVDSIHRRHTDVAFQYMRKADAIVFVLYYTHAFSRADKDFMLQLAGVQDVAGADKLFVVINAVDLAKSAEEQEAVRERVISELRQLGIRQPRVFEVSSQVASAAQRLIEGTSDARFESLLRQRLRIPAEESLPKVEDIFHQSGLPAFRTELMKQVAEQADALSRQAAKKAITQTATRLDGLWRMKLDRQHSDVLARETLRLARATWIHTQQAEELRLLRDASHPTQKALQSEWEELSFHAGERIRYRFGGLVKESFYPGRFRADDYRQSLAQAGDELRAALVRQVELEIRTFALRVASQTSNTLKAWSEELRVALLELQTLFEFPFASMTELPELADQPYRVELDAKALSSAYRHFSSPKQFFEQGGQLALQNELESSLLSVVRTEVDRLARDVANQARTFLQEAQERLLEIAVRNVENASDEEGMGLTESEMARWTDVVDWFHQAAEMTDS